MAVLFHEGVILQYYNKTILVKPEEYHETRNTYSSQSIFRKKWKHFDLPCND